MLIVILFVAVLSAVIFAGAQKIKASEVSRQQIYLSVRIEKGDSLWSIARQYYDSPDGSLNAYIEKLSQLNGLKKDAMLHTGQYLLIPVISEG